MRITNHKAFPLSVILLTLTFLPTLSLSLTGCATAGASRSASDTAAAYVQSLTVANSVYEETLLAAKRAHDAGMLTNDQLNEVRSVAIIVEQALHLSKGALDLYLTMRTPESERDFLTAFATLNQTLSALLKAASQD